VVLILGKKNMTWKKKTLYTVYSYDKLNKNYVPPTFPVQWPYRTRKASAFAENPPPPTPLHRVDPCLIDIRRGIGPIHSIPEDQTIHDSWRKPVPAPRGSVVDSQQHTQCDRAFTRQYSLKMISFSDTLDLCLLRTDTHLLQSHKRVSLGKITYSHKTQIP
jgi:hypothetical protein